MKKSLLSAAVVAMMGLVFLSGCTEQERAKKFGGSASLDLPAGTKLVTVTWKEGGNLWYLTRPMRPEETPETYIFKESSSYGIMEGSVTIKEHASK